MTSTPFTIDWLLDSVGVLGKEGVRNVEITEIGEGKGIVSRVFDCQIQLASSPPIHVVVKIPQVFEEDVFGDPGKGGSFTKEHLARNHNRECDFYLRYAKQLNVPLGKLYRAEKWIPGQTNGALVMESFTGGATSGSFFEGFTEGQMYALTKHLVQLNKYFLCLEDRDWIAEYPNVMWNQMEVINHFITPMVDRLRDLNSEEFRDNIDKVYPLLVNPEFHEFASSGVQEAMNLPPVLSHGDLWTNNLLWKTAPDGSATDDLAAILDWQIIHKGSPSFDFARLLVIGTDGALRRHIQYDLLSFYYRTLRAEMASEGKEVGFTEEQLVKAYHVNFVDQTLMLLSFVCFFDELGSCDQKKRLWNSHNSRLALRAKMAIDDTIELLEKSPVKRDPVTF
ncbi:hypothetical protein QR680_013660 [Steinernema hermaphroditum]|uniref:CHK kinase-like domain-containing protein n=1 Tax=Steinernema hermaphroditum TaxID=289476 RepID=A0AA39M2V9_9BILA|nr:hypothetical protein QR680_013660 [Steinernema hermaphroditum]